MDRIYGRALSVLRSSAQMHVFVAEYVRHYKPNRQLELLHLAAAEVRDQYYAFGMTGLFRRAIVG